MCGYGRRLGRSRLSRQLNWNRSWNRWNTRQTKRGGWGRCKQTRRGGWGHCSAGKMNLADLWSNSDFEFSKKVNAQNGSCYGGLQETGSEKFALKLNCFWINPQEGIGCPSAPLRRGPDGLEFAVQGTMLKVAPVSTKCLSLVNLSVRKISPALAGKGIAVAVACARMAIKFSDQVQGETHLWALLV